MNKKTRPGRLRIVAGKWRGRLLDIADVPGLRPTQDRLRETLFNWLAPAIEGSRCLDLYAGTGALGLEALSRGARDVVFVEQSRRAVATLRDNVETLQANGAEVIHADALDYLARPGSRFDIVFLDPPFAADMLDDLCRLLDDAGLVANGSYVYIEDERDRPETVLPPGWHYDRSKVSGNVRYALARVDGQPDKGVD